MAEKLKASGNLAFTAGRFGDAARLYAQAAALAPNDAVYFSNLSAAQYELGEYSACATTILKTAPLINNSPEALQRKLAHRLARALCHSRVISAFQPEDNEAVDRFEAIARADTANNDAHANWDAWKGLASVNVDSLHADDQQALAKERLFKNIQTSSGLEYYTVGQDDVQSLLLTAPVSPDLELPQLSEKQLSELNFLIGGCGDARHAFGTLSDIHQVLLGNSMHQKQKSAVRIHMTLVDIHPTTVARVLLYLDLLSQLSDALDTAGEDEATATFLYAFIAPVIPEYAHTRYAVNLSACISDTPQDCAHCPKHH